MKCPLVGEGCTLAVLTRGQTSKAILLQKKPEPTGKAKPEKRKKGRKEGGREGWKEREREREDRD